MVEKDLHCQESHISERGWFWLLKVSCPPLGTYFRSSSGQCPKYNHFQLLHAVSQFTVLFPPLHLSLPLNFLIHIHTPPFDVANSHVLGFPIVSSADRTVHDHFMQSAPATHPTCNYFTAGEIAHFIYNCVFKNPTVLPLGYLSLCHLSSVQAHPHFQF